MQDTLHKALCCAHQLKDEQALDAWIFRILVNVWRDYCRAQKELVTLDNVELADTQTPEEQCSQSVLVVRVRNCVAQLSREHREIISLVDLEQMSYKDVADILEIPIGTVMSRLSRARKQLKQNLSNTPQGATAQAVRRVK